MDRGRLHAGAGQPADAGRLDGRPAGTPPRVPGRAGAVHLGLAAVQRRAKPRLADRLSHAAGGWWLDAQPGRDVDHPQRLHRRARASTGDRHVGRHYRYQPRAGASSGRRARRRRRLAGDLLDQHPGRSGGAGADDALRPGVARAKAATPRSCRSAAGDRAARLAYLRDHRGAFSRLALGTDAWPVCPGSGCARVARAI